MKVFLVAALLLLSAVVSGESSWFSAQAEKTSDEEFNFSNGREDKEQVLSIVGNDVGEWGRVYGNWCGPGFGAGKPVDELDAACKNHDECYDDKGYFDCRCDATLVQQAAASFESLEDDDAKDAASLVIDFYSNSPCLCRRSIECGFRCKTCWKWGVPYPCECEYTRCEVVVPVSKNSKCPTDED